jgi:3-dehydrosphinganine reductase
MMRRAPDLRDRHLIVTGGSSGIGLALVRRVACMGARTSVIALADADLERLRASPPEGPRALHVEGADLGDRRQAHAAAAACVERHGECDVLVTCAGIVHPGYFQDLSDEVLEREMQVNYFGTLWPIRAVVPSMRRRGTGSIVAMSSFAALLGVFGYGAYGPSKYAIRGLTDTLRIEMRPHGVHVMCVFPTDVDTPMLAAEIPQHPPEQDAMQGKVRPMSPEVVVDAILEGLARRRARIYPGRWNASRARLLATAPSLTGRILDRAVAKAAREIPSAARPEAPEAAGTGHEEREQDARR